MSQDLAQQLRDIHLPTEPSWWPLALGWWLILALLFLTIAVLIIRKLRIKSHNATSIQTNQPFSVLAYRDLFAAIKKQHQADNHDLKLIQSSSILLRKFCVELSSDSANLTGKAWLEHLNQVFATSHFTQTYKNTLTLGNYAPSVNIDSAAFILFIDTCLDTYSKEPSNA